MRDKRHLTRIFALVPAIVSICSTGCGLHVTHHRVQFRDPEAVSVLIHPPGPGTGQLSLPVNASGAGEPVSYADDSETQPSWSLRASRGSEGALTLEFRQGESLLSSLALIDTSGVLDGAALMDHGVYSSGDRTVVRDPDGLVWTRLGYVPTAPSSRQEGEPDWRRIAALMERSGPGAVSLVTAPDNVASIVRRTEVPWEASALLLTLGAVMIATSIPLFVEGASGDLTSEESGLAIGIGAAAAVGGLVGVVVGTAGFLARDYREPLEVDELPVQQPRGVKPAP